ncbi:TonB-dependent receptor [Sphingosinicellaceae bacterium M-36]
MDATRFLTTVSALATLVAGMPATVRAADDGALPEIIVTAQKREERVRDVPFTITAYGGDFLREVGVGEFDDLSRYVPGLNIQEQSPNNPGFVIRGITSDDGASQSAPRVSIYYNGVDVSRSRGSYFDLFDIEAIEVAKGPQATLFGTAAAIGGISVRSTRPQDGTSASIAGTLGNYDRRGVEGHLNHGGAVFGARLAWSVKQRDGYVENIAGSADSQRPGGPRVADLNGQDVAAVRGSLRYTPGERWASDLIVSFDRQTPPGTAFKSGNFVPTGGTTSPYGFAEIAGAPSALSAQYLGGDQPGLKRTVWDINLTNSYDVGDHWTITAVTGWRKFDSLEVFDADGSQAFYLEFAEDAEGRQFNQELRASFAYDKVKGFVGATYFRETGSQRVPFLTEVGTYAQCTALPSSLAAAYGLPAGTPMSVLIALGAGYSPSSPVVQALLATPCVAANGSVPAAGITAALTGGLLSQQLYTSWTRNSATNESFSVFGDVTYTPAPRLDVTIGVRAVWEDRTARYASNVPNAYLGTTNLGLAPLPFANTGGDTVSASASNNAVMPRFNLLYRLNDATNLYATIGYGRRSPVLQWDSVANGSGVYVPTLTEVPAEKIWNYEGGVKSALFDNRMQLEASVYYQTYENFQVSVVEDSRVVTRNAGEATNWGAELSLRGRPVSGLHLFATLGYVDAKIADKAANGEFANSRFRLQPKWQTSLGLTWDQPVGESLRLFVTPTWTWQSQLYFDVPNSDLLSQDGYHLVNVRAGLGAIDDRWQVEVFANNLFDRNYLIDAGNTGDSFGYPTFIAGEPRMYGMRVKFSM